jgi:hypothetical protein
MGCAGLELEDLTNPSWVKDMPKADKIAAAVLEWAKFNGATSFCHWFQPIASTFRHGQSGQVQNAMFKWDKKNQPVWDLEVIRPASAVGVATTVSCMAIRCFVSDQQSQPTALTLTCFTVPPRSRAADHPRGQLSLSAGQGPHPRRD